MKNVFPKDVESTVGRVLLMSTHNMFHGEVRKILSGYSLLPGAISLALQIENRTYCAGTLCKTLQV